MVDQSTTDQSTTGGGLILDLERLMPIAEEGRARFLEADPFPHIVIDSFLREQHAEALLSEFPTPDAPLEWRKRYVTDDQQVVQANKLGFSDESQLGPTMRQLFWELNSARALRFLERLTGIERLMPDPHLFGGGIHQSLPGAVLAVHADFTRHPQFHLARRLNLLFFLNDHWQDEWGGHLELWSADMERCVRRIAPILNRCVVFETGPKTFHGHPEPLRCPEGTTRKSLALYYYTNDAAERAEGQPVSTDWQRRPSDPAVCPSPSGMGAKITRAVRHPLRTARRLFAGRAG